MLVARILLFTYVTFVNSALTNSTELTNGKNRNSTEELLKTLICAVMIQEYSTKITLMLDMNVENCLENSCDAEGTKNDVYFTCALVKVFRSKFKKCFDPLTEVMMKKNIEKYDCKGKTDYERDGSGIDFFMKEKRCVLSIMNDVCEKGSNGNYDENVAALTEVFRAGKLIKPGVLAPKTNITLSE
ncbi:unnamed protein product [Caenorhabditis brenneri]